MSFKKEEFSFLKKHVRDFELFTKELEKHLVPWTMQCAIPKDDNGSKRALEAQKLMKALGGLSPETIWFFKTFAKLPEAELSKLQEACKLAIDPPDSMDGIPVPGCKRKQGGQINHEVGVLIDSLYRFLCGHWFSFFPPEKNTSVFKNFASAAIGSTTLGNGESAVRKYIEKKYP